MYKVGNKASVCISRTPPDERTSRVDQPSSSQRSKKKIGQSKGTWAEEVPRIVWAYYTTPQSTTKETLFNLVYGLDAMIPKEIQENSPRFQNFVVEESNEERNWTYWMK